MLNVAIIPMHEPAGVNLSARLRRRATHGARLASEVLRAVAPETRRVQRAA